MTMTHWLIVIFGLAALAYRKRIAAVFKWHPVVLFGNVAVVALVIGSFFFFRWVFDLYAWWGLGGLALAGVAIHAWHRIKYGYWLGD